MRRVACSAAVIAISFALGGVTIARADAEPDAHDAGADHAFHAAEQLAPHDPAAALAAFEAVGAARPITRWNDDAWSAAARLAERAGDYDRARVDLGHVLEVGGDEQVRRRATVELARLTAITGAAGQWSALAAQHDALAAQALGTGDPKPALAQLDALVRAHPDYPRVDAVRLVIATGWERDGELPHAIEVLRAAVAVAAPGEARGRALHALVRALIRHGDLADADTQLAALAANPGVDHAVIGELRDQLALAQTRAHVRTALWLALAVLIVVAVIAIRRSATSWRAALRGLARPPIELVFVAPIALVFVAVAWTGNPLVARAVRAIVGAGLVVTWLSGALADAARRQRGRLSLPRALAHALCAVIAVGAVTYLVIGRDRMIDLVAETWRTGPTIR